MILIAHRGNINGKIADQENHPNYITEALNQGYNVEIDVWHIDNKIYLGHDNPQYQIDISFLKNDKLWHHAKNIEALHLLNDIKPNNLINCFYHQTDDCVLTSQGYIWTYPNKPIISNQAIAVMPELFPDWDISKAGGICSDFIKQY